MFHPTKKRNKKHHMPNAMSKDTVKSTIYCPVHCVPRSPKGNWLLAKSFTRMFCTSTCSSLHFQQVINCAFVNYHVQKKVKIGDIRGVRYISTVIIS